LSKTKVDSSDAKQLGRIAQGLVVQCPCKEKSGSKKEPALFVIEA